MLIEKEAAVCLWGIKELVVLIRDRSNLSDKAMIDKNYCHILIACFEGFASGQFKFDMESLSLQPFQKHSLIMLDFGSSRSNTKITWSFILTKFSWILCSYENYFVEKIIWLIVLLFIIGEVI